MRLPKRVPWSNLSELEQLCSWIYAAEDDIASKILAVNKLAAWKAATALPHSLESTLSLLIVILQDEDFSNSSTPHSSTLFLRQSYSLSLIRLVNGLVDPLQQGAYARPIASIAEKIGLPLWLVELRHASTHEELPSLELLREAAREGMSWLLRNYFLPTVAPMIKPLASPVTLPSLSPLLLQYKQLMKATTRDTSLKSRSKPELDRILRGFEQWISEAKLAASQDDENDERERWALDRFCDVLTGRGGLVPVSKRKRPSPSQGLTIPIPQHVTLWSPLLQHVHSRYPAFPSNLLSRIVAHLLPPTKSKSDLSTVNVDTIGLDAISVDMTYDHTLATWALWIVDCWSDELSTDDQRRDVIKELLLGLGRGGDHRVVRALTTALAEGDSQMREVVDLLSPAILCSSRVSVWGDDALDVMSNRLESLQTQLDGPKSSGYPQDVEMAAPGGHSPSKVSNDKEMNSVKGWRILDEGDGWKPCPIGIFHRTSS